MNGLIEQIPAVLIALLTGGGLVALLVHRREKPRADAETATLNWTLFNSEIARLNADILNLRALVENEREKRFNCEEKYAAMEAKMGRLEGIMQGRGEGLQQVQEVISAANVKEHKAALDELDRKTGDSE